MGGGGGATAAAATENLTENNVNGRLKGELQILIERLEGALVKFKERKEKMRQPHSVNNYGGI